MVKMSEEKYKNMGLIPSYGDASISFILFLFFRSASITFIFSSKVTLKRRVPPIWKYRQKEIKLWHHYFFVVNLRDGRPLKHSPLYKKRGCLPQQAPCGCDQSVMRSFLFYFIFYVTKCGGLVATQTISTV